MRGHNVGNGGGCLVGSSWRAWDEARKHLPAEVLDFLEYHSPVSICLVSALRRWRDLQPIEAQAFIDRIRGKQVAKTISAYGPDHPNAKGV